MDLPPLPPELSGWQVRRPTSADADALHDLVHGLDIALLGLSDISRDDVAADLAGSAADAATNQLVVTDGERALAWVWVEDRAEQRTALDVFVDRTRTADRLEPLARWAFDAAVARGRAIAADHGWASTRLEMGVLAADTATAAWLRDVGFASTRTYWRMSRPVRADDRWPPSPGVVVRTVTPDDVEVVHEILEGAFADHWNHVHIPFEPWWQRAQERAAFDLSLWWLASVDGQPVGALIATRSGEEDDTLHVPTLGVRREARGRGVARALLHRVFTEAPARGWSRVALEVDGENPTGATALYRSVGMVVNFTFNGWQRTVDASPRR